MQIVDLFSGIGGFSLAGSWLGWRTIQFCEIDPWCHKVLKRHWPNVPIHTDINTLTPEIIKQSPLYNENEETIITGGVPCQPASTAGKRRGESDERWLWPQTIKFIGKFKPTFAVLENVAGLVSMENGKTLDRILSDLENEGYATEQVIIPACAVGAWHRRDRIWIVAQNARSYGRRNGEHEKQGNIRDIRQSLSGGEKRDIREKAEYAPNTISKRGCSRDTQWKYAENVGKLPGGKEYGDGQFESHLGRMAPGLPAELDGYWDREPEGVQRVATGVKDMVNRLKGLGNSILPQVVFEIYKAIQKLEDEKYI